MRIVVSIPVHEKPEVINDLILNIHKYIPDSVIVLHISQGFYEEYNEKDILRTDYIFINPQHLQTQWGQIYKTHVSNFLYMKDMDFDYFLLQASNDMFVRYGIEDYIKKYDAGFNCRILWQRDSMWWPCSCAQNDSILKKIMQELGVTRIYGSQVEGSFYKKELFSHIVNVIEKYCMNADIVDKKNSYPREEIYYSTIASKFVDFGNCGFPTTFSEVHRFDRRIWKIRKIIDLTYIWGLKFIFDRSFIDKIEGKLNDWLFRSRTYSVTTDDIQHIVQGKNVQLIRNCFLNDFPGYWQISAGYYFSVKRVQRNIKDPIRIYIRNL